MKIKYILQNINTRDKHIKIYSLETIEKEGLKGLFDIENYRILKRLKSTGITDKIKKIYLREIWLKMVSFSIK